MGERGEVGRGKVGEGGKWGRGEVGVVGGGGEEVGEGGIGLVL